jgi:hypothetical protein
VVFALDRHRCWLAQHVFVALGHGCFAADWAWQRAF